MSVSRQRAKEIFLAALDRPSAEQAAFLAEACGEDAALREEVESLLQFHDAAKDVDVAVFVSGEVFADRYRMVERIGRGGMGDVGALMISCCRPLLH